MYVFSLTKALVQNCRNRFFAIGYLLLAPLTIGLLLLALSCSAFETGSEPNQQAGGGQKKQGEFLGFDPKAFEGEQLESDTLQKMVEEAKKATPPNSGDEYQFGFANLQRDIAFAIKVEKGIKENVKAADLELAVADNQLSGQVALQNAQSFATRNMDYAIEFQTDVEFGPQVMQEFNQANIPVIAIDIPMPGATFFGVNNPRSGFMGGSYLAQAALAKWGDDEVQKGYFVIGELPQSGAIPALRTAGQRKGFLTSAEGFPEDQIIGIDTKNTLEESFQQMSNVLGRIPKGVPIMVTAINDQSATGMLRAIERAGRSEDALVVGLGADEIETLVNEEKFIASVGSFPERYGNYIIPLALMQLAGYETPDAVLVKHEMITPMNVCDYYDQDCQEPEDYPEFSFQFPQQEYNNFVKSLRSNPRYEDYEAIIQMD